ncbi:MAG: hypothetical protein PHE33_09420 [Bacteroidales bacterium]|nr:hypothetical protein [Bacteroidales bacterium]
MKNIIIILIGIIVLVVSCDNIKTTDSEIVIDANELKVGANLGDLKISNIEIDSSYIVLKFSNEIEVEGLMIFDVSPTMISIKHPLLNDKINVNGTELDLSNYDMISFTNYENIQKFIPLDWKSKSTSDYWNVKDEFNEKINIKVKINNISFCNDEMYNLTANIVEVTSFDNNIKPEIVTNPELKNISARLNMVALSTDGAWAIFNDDDGNSYKFFDDGNVKLHQTLNNIELNVSDHKYKNILFDIEYKTVSHPFYDGGSGETVFRNVEIITSINAI